MIATHPMQTRSINKFVMFIAVQKHCNHAKFEEAIAHLPAFEDHWLGFDNAVDAIRLQEQSLLGLNSVGATENKSILREELAEKAAGLSAAVVAYAKGKRDEELAVTAHVTKTLILGGRDIEATITVNHLLTLTESLLPELGRYGVTEARVNQLRDRNIAFAELVGRPIAIIGRRKEINDTLPDLFAEADSHLEQLDRISESLEEAYPEFVTGYRTSRKIHHVAASRSLSPAQQADADARQAKEMLKQALEEARIAEVRAKAQADRGKALAIKSGNTEVTRERNVPDAGAPAASLTAERSTDLPA